MSKTVVLIDDDKIIRSSWEKRAALSEVLVITYHDVKAFLDDEKLYQRDIDIYIDSDIEGADGEELARSIFAAGFKSITLLSSFNFDRLEKVPSFIKAITNKSPPF